MTAGLRLIDKPSQENFEYWTIGPISLPVCGDKSLLNCILKLLSHDSLMRALPVGEQTKSRHTPLETVQGR